MLDDSTSMVQSDTLGRFHFSAVTQGYHELSFRHISFPDKTVSLYLSADTAIRLYFSNRTVQMPEIIVPEHRTEELVVYSQSKLTGADMSHKTGMNIAQVLAQLPGVQTFNTGSTISKPVIQGLHSQRIVVIQNEQRLEGQQWGNEHGIEAIADGLSEIRVIKGAAGVKFGPDAIGGVIHLIPEKLPFYQTALSGDYSFQFFHNNLQLGSQLSLRSAIPGKTNLAWEVKGSYNRAGDIRAPAYYQSNTGFSQGTASIRLGGVFPVMQFELGYQYFGSELGIFSGAHIGNLTDLQNTLLRDQPVVVKPFSYSIGRPKQNIHHHSIFVHSQIPTRSFGKLNLRWSWQLNDRMEFDKHVPRNDSLAALNRPAYRFQIQTHSADLSWKHDIQGTWLGETGISGMSQTNQVEFSYFIPAFWNFGLGWFALEKWIKGRWEVEAGVRLDYRWMQALLPDRLGGDEPILTFFQPSGSIGFEYHFKQNTTLSYRISSAWRPPHVSELYADGLHHGSAVYELGDRNLKRETGWSQSISFEHETQYGFCKIDAFTHWIRGYLYAKPAGELTLTSRGAFPTWVFTQTDALLSGADIQVCVRPIRFFEVTLLSSLILARDIPKADWLDFIPPQTIQLNGKALIPDFRFFKQNSISLQGRYVFRQTLFSTPDYSQTPEGYFLLQTEWNTHIRWNKTIISLSITVRNMLNSRFRDYLNRFRYYTDEQGADFQFRLRIPFSFSKTN